MAAESRSGNGSGVAAIATAVSAALHQRLQHALLQPGGVLAGVLGVSDPSTADAAAAAAAPGRRLLAAAAAAPRVLGVGAGVFVLGFFLLVSVAICLVGTRARRPGVVYAAGALLFATVAAVLLGSPKGYRAPPAPQGYDRTLVPLALVGALMCAGVGASGAALLAFVAREAVYARPLSYSADVLGQR